MRRFRVYSILLLALALHLTVLNYIKIFGAKPDVLLLSVMFFGIFLGPRMGFESGLAAGFLEDIFTLDVFWINTFIFAITGLAVGILNERFFKQSKTTRLTMVFSFTAFSMTAHFLSATLLTKSIKTNLFEYLAISIIPTAIYTTLVSIPAFSKLMSLYGLKEKDEELL